MNNILKSLFRILEKNYHIWILILKIYYKKNKLLKLLILVYFQISFMINIIVLKKE